MDEDQQLRLAALQAAVTLTGPIALPAEKDDPNGVAPAAKEAIRVADAFVKYVRDNDPYPLF
ncbi:hypothetical protein ABZ341_32615 [Streptomyces sp. NPDC006173]|uniref:hypothetical protein n=1 Tax=Streptomyces sp. NPDC006173 TaxID=3155349 RepID=UPI00340FDC79